jgi:glutamate formiminotransferase / 5-formyltetrahydrofolate cyclo-ligase
VREQGGGLPGVRAIGIKLERQEAVHLSTNVEDPFKVPLRALVERVRSEAERNGVTVVGAELVGLAPNEALDGFPEDLPLHGFEPNRHILENRLRSMPAR